MNFALKKKQGFTIMEIMIVVFIMGVLLTITVSSLSDARQRNRNTTRVSDINQLQIALSAFERDVGSYPTIITGGQEFRGTGIASTTVYMAKVPTPPTPQDGFCDLPVYASYYYLPSAAARNYCLFFCLGDATGDLGAGPKVAKPNGITYGAPMDVLWERFEGDFSDSTCTPKANPTNSGVTIASSTAGFGSSAFFGTGEEYLSFADNNDWDFGTGDFTVDFWFNMTALSGNKESFVIGNTPLDSVVPGWEVTLRGNDASDIDYLSFNIETNAVFGWTENHVFSFPSPVAFGGWHHAAVVRSGGRIFAFLDGQRILANGATSEASTANITSASTLDIGAKIGGTSDWDFNGYLDEIRVAKGYVRWNKNFIPASDY